MSENVNELLAKDLEEIKVLPDFVEVSNRCVRQMCRSGVIDLLARQPGVNGLGIETVAYLFDEATTVIGELMILLAKLYKEKGLPIVIEASADDMRAEEAAKFGMAKTEEEEEEEECQSSPSEPNKNLN
jgi:hypothetical protein